MLSGVEIWPKVQWAPGQQVVPRLTKETLLYYFLSDSLTTICQFSVGKQCTIAKRWPSAGQSFRIASILTRGPL